MRVEHDEGKNCKILKGIPLHPEVLRYALQHTDYLHSWTDFNHETNVVIGTEDFMQSFKIYAGEDQRTSRVLLYPYKHSESMREKTGRDYQQEIDDCIEFLQDFVEAFKEEDFSHLP